MDSLDQAIYDLVHKSDITPKGIADRLNIPYQSLLNKANPNGTYHKLTLREVHAIQLITGNHALVCAMQVELNLNERKTAPESVLASVLNAGKEHGDVLATIQDAMADGKFTEREKADSAKEIREAIASLNTLLESVMSHGKDLGISTH